MYFVNEIRLYVKSALQEYIQRKYKIFINIYYISSLIVFSDDIVIWNERIFN